MPVVPTPPEAPSRLNPGPDYADKSDALAAWYAPFVAALNTYADDLADENGVANYSATSATSLAIGTGTKNFTTQTGKRYVGGEFVTVASAADPVDDYMYGRVTSYNSLTGALVVDSQRIGPIATGTHTDWLISLSGPQGEAGDTLPSFSGNGSAFLRLNAAGSATEWAFNNYMRQAADRTLTSTTAAQKLFNATTNGALTLPVGHYSFELCFSLTGMDATSGNATPGLLGAGTATLATQQIWATGIDEASIGLAIAQMYSRFANGASTIDTVADATGTSMSVIMRGTFTVTVAGTIIPSIALETAAAATLKAGSYFLCTPLGTAAYGGNWS